MICCRGERRNRLSRLAGVNSIGNYIPFSTHSIRQNWEMWNGIGGLPRRPIRREPRQDPNVEPMAIPPLINLVEGKPALDLKYINPIENKIIFCKYTNIFFLQVKMTRQKIICLKT